jgi:glycosyltransferase involved in cell wall biosynthesis
MMPDASLKVPATAGAHCSSRTLLPYVLITPARNEADYIEHTLRAVTTQTHCPLRWVIVSDGSTDATDEIVQRYAAQYEWIDFVRLPPRKERHFAAKVQAFNAGYARVRDLPFEVIGNLDADVSFDEDYLEYLVGQFATDPELGVAGTHYVEGAFHSYRDSYINVHHVNGQCQLFRRRCFEDIGGYVPIKGGGIDWVAVTTARMRGWKTYSFGDRLFTHHRMMGTAGGSELGARFHYGKKDYFLGGHPLWQLARGTFQMSKRPYVVGGLALIAGYAWCWITRHPRPVSADLTAFHRREQMQRLRDMLSRQGESAVRR